MNKEQLCPECGRKFTDYPALSRKDNKTRICPKCGVKEAILYAMNYYKSYFKSDDDSVHDLYE